MTQKKVHVGVRVRPALKRELVKREGVGLCYRSSLAFHPMYGVLLRTNDSPIVVEEEGGLPPDVHVFDPDYVFDSATDTETVYRQMIQANIPHSFSSPTSLPLPKNEIEEKHFTIFAVGMTGSGKTHTILGSPPSTPSSPPSPGLLHYLLKDIFQTSKKWEENGHPNRVSVKMSCVEVLGWNVTDLFTNTTKKAHNYIGLKGYSPSWVNVPRMNEFEKRLVEVRRRRRTAGHQLNSTSSRSHLIVSFQVKWYGKGEKGEWVEREVMKYRVVDLAGNERVKESGVRGGELKDSIQINLSLFHLVQAIRSFGSLPPQSLPTFSSSSSSSSSSSLSSSSSSSSRVAHQEESIPSGFKTNPLSFLLRNSFLKEKNGGLCVLGTLSPSHKHSYESLSTLRFISACSDIPLNAPSSSPSIPSPASSLPSSSNSKSPPPREEKDERPWIEEEITIQRKSMSTSFGEISYLQASSLSPPNTTGVIFLHGYPSSAEGSFRYWNGIEASAYLGYPTIAPDMPSCGHSEGPPLKTHSSLTLAPHGPADLVVEIARQKGWKKIILVGSDWGGGIALSMATSPKFSKILEKVIVILPSFSELSCEGNGKGKGGVEGVKIPVCIIHNKDDLFHSWGKFKSIYSRLSKRQCSETSLLLLNDKTWCHEKIECHMVEFLKRDGKKVEEKGQAKRGELKREECVGRTTDGKEKVVEERNVIIAEKGGENVVFGLSKEEVALSKFCLWFREGKLEEMYRAFLGREGPALKQEAIKIFASLPELSPSTLSSPHDLQKYGLWETIPEGWEKTKEIKRYTKGRILLIGPPDLFGELVSFCPSTNLVYVLPLYPSSDSSSPLVPMGIPLPKILALNQRHGFPIFGKDLIMEDGIRCRFSSPLTKAKITEIALTLAPLAASLNFNDPNHPKIIQQCLVKIRHCLNIITFQTSDTGSLNQFVQGVGRHIRDTHRYCKDDAAMFAIEGQGHCHTVSSVFLSFLAPFESVLGLDLYYREDDRASHQWVEVVSRPTMSGFVSDLYREETMMGGKRRQAQGGEGEEVGLLAQDWRECYGGKALYPTEKRKILSGYPVYFASFKDEWGEGVVEQGKN